MNFKEFAMYLENLRIAAEKSADMKEIIFDEYWKNQEKSVMEIIKKFSDLELEILGIDSRNCSFDTIVRRK